MKIAASILLLFLIGSSLFYYGYFDVMLFRSKEKATHSVAAAEHNHSLRLFKISASEQDKYNNDEVRINGDLYDVGDREIINDTLYMSLYHDTDEQNVLTDITDFFKADDATVISVIPGKPSLNSVRVVLNPQYYFESLPIFLKLPSNNITSFFNRNSLISLHFFDIITPPPQLS